MWELGRRSAAGVVVLGCLGLAAPTANAFNFSVAGGDIQGAFDTDITYGLSVRTQSPSPTNQGAYGNRELFDERWDIFSHTLKASHTLELNGSGWGTLIRGNYFYDFEMANQPLPDAAENRAEMHGDITDAYFYTYLGANDQISLRIGKQVISWGENTFIGGALADINTVDISKLRQPGSDLKDAFTGTSAIDISWTFGENWTAEAFYLFGFDEIKVDPMGSFFTTLDAIADGGGMINNPLWGASPAAGPPPACIAPDGVSCTILGPGLIGRIGDDIPSYGGQWGVALRVFVPTLFAGSEFGIYYQNLHDHLPMLSTLAGTSRYFLDYPENVERWGLSFNTNYRGVAWSGEYSYRRNAPIQLTAPLLAATPLVGPPITVPVGTKLEGFDRIERHQVQVTMNKNWGVMHAIGADASATIAEFMRGFLGGKPATSALFEPAISEDYGKLVVRHNMTYNAALFNLIALEPNIAFSWDLHGFSNELGGAKLVVEDRKALTLGLGFLYQGGTWNGNVSWTRFWGQDDEFNLGGGRYNGTTDRDFLSFNISYSF